MEAAKALAVGDVPYYGDLNQYDWVDDFRKLLALDDQISRIADQIIALKEKWPTREEILEQASVRYDEYRKRRALKIQQRMLIRQSRSTGSIRGQVNFKNSGEDILGGTLILWEEFEEAVQDLDQKGLLVNQEKIDERNALHADMEALEKQFEALCPSKFSRKPDFFAEDIRRVFYEHWLKIQKKTNGPVNPRRIDLFLCPPQERAAWENLGLAKHIGKNVSEGPAAAPTDFFQ